MPVVHATPHPTFGPSATGLTYTVSRTLASSWTPGDEVVVPSFTFYASAEAIPPTGARPVFCDVDPETFCVTPETVQAAITPRTRAIMVNTPHNPTGKVFHRSELDLVAAVCREHERVAVADEVYDHPVVDGADGAPAPAGPG